ncbi:MAG: hypothetical protein C4527_06325 [Candidatus Omnitrophota bacterium]|nr:MAG: hypothetical protein C4527_06325 [Candidatus Omnitrophota bacterium]
METIHLIGVGGSGMLPLAELLLRKGFHVTGSDRLLKNPTELDHLPAPIRKRLRRLTSLGAHLFAQDGTGITEQTKKIVISTAIEEDNPDLRKADAFHIPISHRAEELHRQIGDQRLLAIAGVSGKSTTAALCAWLLLKLNALNCFVGGAEILDDAQTGIGWTAVHVAHGEWSCVELDESDKSLLRFQPEIAILLNISRDHHEYEENLAIFKQFSAGVQKTILLNRDDPGCRQLSEELGRDPRVKWFTPPAPADVMQTENGVRFRFNEINMFTPLLGYHNAVNLTAALSIINEAAPHANGRTLANAAASFPGVRRRLQRYGKGNIAVYDDYAHNPEKIAALLTTLQQHYLRVFLIFQPHGYAPLKFHLPGFAEVFSTRLRKQDHLLLLPIYDAGGTTNRSISSQDLADHISFSSIQTVRDRREAIAYLRDAVRVKDAVCVVGARDDTLAEFAEQISICIGFD